MNENKDKQELEFNKNNREDYEKLMKESSTNLDSYWDKDNIFVKVFLICLLVVIAIGSFVVISSYLIHK